MPMYGARHATTIHAHEFHNEEGISFEWDDNIGQTEPHFYQKVVEALGVLEELVLPLSIHVSFGPVDPEYWVHLDMTQLRHRQLAVRFPTGVIDWLYKDPHCSHPHLTSLDKSTIHELLRDLVKSEQGSTPPVTWYVIECGASIAYLGDNLIPPIQLQLDDRGRIIEIEPRNGWFAGPRLGMQGPPPLSFRFLREFRQMELGIVVNWSWWTYGPGKVLIDSVQAQLEARGWRRKPKQANPYPSPIQQGSD